MTGRTSNKGRGSKRHTTVKDCPICTKPKYYFSQEWSYQKHMRMRHDEM